MGGKQTEPSETAVQTEKKNRKALWITLAAAALLAAGFAGVCVYACAYDAVFPGVTLAGEDLSGLSRSQLEDRVSADALLQGTVTVTANGLELGKYTQEELGAKVESAALADAAWSVGRAGGPFGWLKNGWTMARGALGGKTVLPLAVGGYDEAILRQTAAALAGRFDRAPVSGNYALTEEGLFATRAADGQTLDQAGLVRALAAMDGSAGEVQAPWASVRAEELDLEALALELDREVSPARYDIETGQVVEGQASAALDPEAAAFVLSAAAPGERVLLPAEIAWPELTAAKLEEVLFRDVLSTAYTDVSGTGTRKSNVRLSGETVNGTVLNDGDIFDYNLVVGQRTVERGFGTAPTYVNGETVDSVGGGVCQTSSTIYLAALLADLEIVTRSGHRYWPGYIAKGMDATVSWGGPEFRFKNNTGYPIRVDVTYENDRITVTILGTKTDDTYVRMTYHELSTTDYETIYQETDELPYGTQQEKQNGYVGRKVETYRNVYNGDGTLISSTLEAVTSYSKRDRIILVGTAGKPEAVDPGPGGDAVSETYTESGDIYALFTFPFPRSFSR